MERIDELTAILNQQVKQNNEEIWRYIKQVISEYEREVSRLKEENSRQRMLNAVWSPHVCLNRAEVLQHPACREEVSPCLAQEEPWTPGIEVKEEQEELSISRGGEGCHETKEDDFPQDPSPAGSVKKEDDEEFAPPSLLDQTEAEPPAWDSDPHIKPEPQPLSCISDQYEPTELHVKEEEGGESGAVSEAPGLCSDKDSEMGIGQAKFIEKLFCCSVCELECVSKAHLRTHMRVHTGERPYACPDCGKAFTTKGGANRHIRGIHHGERPFRCEFCTFSFTVKSGLSRHLRVHTGERPYTCSFCGLSFTQSGNLATHINVHHRRTSLKCKMKA